MSEHFDVIIVGAGLSGVAAGYHLQDKCPSKRFAILEARDAIGGTWDLFRYPGIRSDSDMYTLGYSFKPWPGPDAIAEGGDILDYIRSAADEFGITDKIRFRQRVTSVSWSSQDARWTIESIDPERPDHKSHVTCDFFWSCTGYYRYDMGHTPDFAGTERFEGQIVHPQFWTEDVDYVGKRVVVIGSGATAVTLVPSIAPKAEHVVMLQRSPSYVTSIPRQDAIAGWLGARLPDKAATDLIRWKNVLIGTGFYQFCKRYPERARKFLVGQVRKAVGDNLDVDTHFNPRYDPWDQRLCLVPDGDFFKAIRDGSVSVVTDHIETFTETGIQLKSGEHLPADLIVTATGLHLQFLGGATMSVDGRDIALSETMMYKGMMLSDVPNAAFCLGYSNASWTLKAELACEYVCKLLKLMDGRGYATCVPRRDPEVENTPPMDLNSGYIERALHMLPTQGHKRPWRLYQNYFFDRITLRHARVDDGILEFSRKTP